MNVNIPNIDYEIGTFVSALVSVRLPWQTFCSNFSSFLHDDQGPVRLFFKGLDSNVHYGTLTSAKSNFQLLMSSFDPLTLAYWQTNKHTQTNSPRPTDWAIGSESGPAWTVVAANFGFQMSAFFLLQEKLRKSS